MQVVFQDRYNSLSFKLKFIHFQTTPIFLLDSIFDTFVKCILFCIFIASTKLIRGPENLKKSRDYKNKIMRKIYLTALTMIVTLVTFSQNIPNYVPKDGLVGYWPFNGNANDESGNGHDGTVNGATLSEDKNGAVNSAYSFNGSNYILMSAISQLTTTSNSKVSISFWFNSNSSIGSDFLNMRSTNNSDLGAIWNYPSSNKVSFNNYNMTLSAGTVNETEQTITSDSWNFLVGVFDYTNNNCIIYVNGKMVTKKVYNQTNYGFLDNPKLTIGARNDNSNSIGSFFTGKIDDIAIYNRALTEQEISNLYLGCSHEAASSNLGNSLYLTSDKGVDLVASPAGGTFSGGAVKQGKFEPTSAKIGVNKVVYNYKNSAGCEDVTEFKLVVADTNGTVCKFTDTVKVIKTETKYDTVIVKNNVYDTVIVNKTKFDTITITNKVTKYDTVLVNKYDTIMITKNVTKYDTVLVNKYDTITINKTVVDTLIVKNNIYDTVKVTKYDTVTFKNTIYDTILVNKYDTITTMDTVSILKINFKLTTGIYANQMTSMSLYPNPTSDILHIEVGDVKGLEGYRYRIMDALGKELYNELVKTAITEIPLKTLGAEGMYLFEVLDTKNSSIQSNKIVLQ